MKRHARKRIMLVDDDTHLLVTLTDCLEAQGFAVTRAENGRKALDLLDEVQPDLIILDIGMPEISGLTFLKEISAGGGKPRFPVLIFTAKAVMESFFSEFAVEGFISKPCAEAQLLKIVREVLERHERRSIGASRKRRLILAEDDVIYGQDLARGFEKAGYDVELVHNGTQVLESASLLTPDVIVMKDSLPRVTGTTMANMISSIPSLKLVPIVVYEPPESGTQMRLFHGELPPGVSRYLLDDRPFALQQAVEDVCSS